MGRPRSGEWASSEFSGLAALGVTDLVSLLESSEARDLELHNEASLCGAASIAFHAFPIPDRGTPSSVSALSKLACNLYHSVADGHGVAIHCRAGIGRSGLVAAAVLMHGGHSMERALSQISKARGVPVPDTPEQAEWLRTHRAAIGQCRL